MATKKPRVSNREAVDIEPTLREVSKKLPNCRSLRHGNILVRTTGPGGGDYYVQSSDRGVELKREAPMETLPDIEIMGEGRVIQAALGGGKDVRALFLSGGLRVRGDLRYLSDLALELDILKEPL